MRQVLNHLGSGALELAQVPCPALRAGTVRIQTRATLISPGTERMLMEFGKAGWIEKARQQPERVAQVLDKVRTDGLSATVTAVRAKLDREIPLGYSNCGVVLEVGAGVTGFRAGDRVVSNGPHAEIVVAPASLCARIPEGVSDEAAAFTVLGAIALESLRLAEPTLGERFAVFGLGPVGLLAVGLLRAQGCGVLAIDFDAGRLAVAEGYGAKTVNLGEGDDPQAAALEFSAGRGVDGAILATATSASAPVREAARMTRTRGRVILAGTAGLALERDEFFRKEIRFQVSCSYGPGRYDADYEERGRDYPFGYVRWTAQRNFEAFLGLLAEGRVDVRPLITHRFRLEEMEKAYALVEQKKGALGILLAYEKPDRAPLVTVRAARQAAAGTPVIGVIGAGQYAGQVLLPLVARSGARLHTVVSAQGVSAAWAARKFGFERAASETELVLEDPEINTVIVATRHDTHGALAAAALARGKHVFVEKPLARSEEEIEEIARRAGPCLAVGLNRRFAPLTGKLIAARRRQGGACQIRMLINAGAVPASHWTQRAEQGGGRILGEGCHFIDLARALAGAPVAGLEAMPTADADGGHLWMEFADGSTAAIDYVTSGHRSFPKERVEVIAGGRVWVIDNFRRLESYPGASRWGQWWARQDKGQAAMMETFLAAVRAGGPAPVPLEEVLEVARWTLAAARQLERR